MIELIDGNLEVLPTPTWLHQLIVKFLVRAVLVASEGVGEVLDAPLPIRLFEQNIREPDVMHFAPGSEPKDPRGYPTHVDLAMEVVSEGAEAAKRDDEDNRRDYAQASPNTGLSTLSSNASRFWCSTKPPTDCMANSLPAKPLLAFCCPHLKSRCRE